MSQIDRRFRLRALLPVCARVAAALLAASALCSAATLPPPETLATCEVFPAIVTDPSACSVVGASGSLSLSPFVVETAQMSAIPGTGPYVNLNAKIYFEVIGGNVGDVVPLVIFTDLHAFGTTPGKAYGIAQIELRNGANITVCSEPTCGGEPHVNAPSDFTGSFNSVGVSGFVGDFVDIQVQASMLGLSSNPESASASADPLIMVDPTFAGASQYSIVLSPGVGNGIAGAPGAPEPGTFVLLGLSAIGMFLLRRQMARSN